MTDWTSMDGPVCMKALDATAEMAARFVAVAAGLATMQGRIEQG